MKKTIIRNILQVFAVGGAAAGLGAAAIAFACLGVWIYCTIPTMGGYAAVVLFMLATLSVAVAFAVVYMCGCWITRKGKYAK